jgi:hypothetical protein
MTVLSRVCHKAAWRFSAARGKRAAMAAALGIALVACAPALDWRELRPAGTQLQLLFPCKPTSQQRTLNLAGAPVALTLHACQAGNLTWALSHADVADPARVASALTELKAAAQIKMGQPEVAWVALITPGATPNAQSGLARFSISGADRQALQMHVAVFAHGTRVFQAAVLGSSVPAEAADAFFSSLRVQP